MIGVDVRINRIAAKATVSALAHSLRGFVLDCEEFVSLEEGIGRFPGCKTEKLSAVGPDSSPCDATL